MTGRTSGGMGGLLLALAAGCVLATACGGSARPSADSATFASSYLTASHSYRTHLAQLQSQASTAQQQGTAAEVAIFRGILDLTNSTIDEMQHLNAPSDLSKKFDQFRASLHDQRSSLNDVLTAVNDNDNPAIDKAVVALSRAFQNGLTLQNELDSAAGAATKTSTTTG